MSADNGKLLNVLSKDIITTVHLHDEFSVSFRNIAFKWFSTKLDS